MKSCTTSKPTGHRRRTWRPRIPRSSRRCATTTKRGGAASSRSLNDFVPISIGAKQQPVVELTSGDWEGIYADNTGYVREAVGGPTGGHWHILVEEPGDYEFTLRRWPEQTKAALGDKYETSPKSPANKANPKTVGFPTIARAMLQIAGKEAESAANPKEAGVTLVVANLPAGKTKLKGWFADAEGNNLCGAFFITVSRKDR